MSRFGRAKSNSPMPHEQNMTFDSIKYDTRLELLNLTCLAGLCDTRASCGHTSRLTCKYINA